jgi:hypothetical protein
MSLTVQNSSEINNQLSKMINRMQEHSSSMNVTKGVAVSAWWDKKEYLISQGKVCGSLTDDYCNFMAIAYAKLTEMCNTLQNSGSQERKLLAGEQGWVGGAIKNVNDIYYIAAFSGATSEDDLVISQFGLEAV